jgi:hypothetical protein
MKKTFISMILLGAIAAPAWAAQPTCANPVGAWGNQLKSTLVIDSVDQTTGAIKGTYESPSGTSAGQKFSVTGWTNKAPAVNGQDNVTLLSFSVRWGSYGSITSWSGICREENRVPVLNALWHLAQSNAQFSWGHVLTGNDVFTPAR